jgi:hypothetical protein
MRAHEGLSVVIVDLELDFHALFKLPFEGTYPVKNAAVLTLDILDMSQEPFGKNFSSVRQLAAALRVERGLVEHDERFVVSLGRPQDFEHAGP